MYKALYPFLLSMEFAAVQIIAVDTVQNSGSLIAGYLSKAGKSIKNNGSTGDLNRGRRTESRLLFGSFCRSKKNKLVSLSGKFEVLQTSIQLTKATNSHNPIKSLLLAADMLVAATTSLPLRGFPGGKAARTFPDGNICPTFEKAGQKVRTPPHTVTREACTNISRFACNRLASQAFVGFAVDFW